MVEAVINILIANTGVQALVGRNEADDKYKVYPVITPQKEKYPYITVRQTGKARDGKGCSYSGSYAVFSYHKSYDEVLALDLAVVKALEDNHSGLISFSNLSNTSDDYVTNGDGDGLYSRISIFDCSYNESDT